MYENRFNKVAPVKEGDELDVKIEALGEKGDGIAKKNGFVLVIPGTQKDDEVRVRVTKVLKKVGFAEVIGKAEKQEKEELPEQSEQLEETSEDLPEEHIEDSENFGEEN